MAQRIAPADRIRVQIEELFASGRSLSEILEELGRLAIALVLQVAAEAEVTEFLGRDRYARGEREQVGYRNGHRSVTIKTTTGPVRVQRPRVRDTLEPFASQLFGSGVVRSNALEALIIAGFVRGLSMRDVEAALREALGDSATVSKSTVSRICEAIKDEFATWRCRSLSGIDVAYLFADASMFKMHSGAKGEPVLACWGITMDGKPVFLALQPDSGESTDGWADCFEDLKARGLAPPLLGISDGAGGLINAFELIFKRSGRQRCLVHRVRNILAKVPKQAQDEVKAAFWAIFDDIEASAGAAAVAEAQRRANEFRRRYAKLYPAAVRCLDDDFDSLCTHLRFPKEHWKRIRHSNFIERTFGETRRRVKVIGRFPGEDSCLSLVWAVLDRAARGWRGVKMTPAITRVLQQMRLEMLAPAKKEVTKRRVATAA